MKCCRIQSDHRSIAGYDAPAFGAGTLTWQAPVHSWKAGPGEVETVENKQTNKRKSSFKLLYLGFFLGKSFTVSFSGFAAFLKNLGSITKFFCG